MPRVQLTIEYDGTGLAGWQRQADVPTVQQYVEEAIGRYFDSQERIAIQCAGRTDAGVHARAQVAHADFPEMRAPHSIILGINHHLASKQIAIIDAQPVADDFNARFDATMRHYEYRIINRKAPLTIERNRAWNLTEQLDARAMHEAAQQLVGTHDFSSFRDAECQAKSPLKSIESINIMRDGDSIVTQLKAISFLHHQVRIIMGTLKNVGAGKWQSRDIKRILAAQDRTKAGETAPACGLYFMRVDY